MPSLEHDKKLPKIGYKLLDYCVKLNIVGEANIPIKYMYYIYQSCKYISYYS